MPSLPHPQSEHSSDDADIELDIGWKSPKPRNEIEVYVGQVAVMPLLPHPQSEHSSDDADIELERQSALRSPRQRHIRDRSLSSASRNLSVNSNYEFPPVPSQLVMQQQEKAIVWEERRAPRPATLVPGRRASSPFSPTPGRIPDRELLQRSIVGRHPAHSLSNSIPALWKPSISTNEDAAPSEHFAPRRQGSMTSLRSASLTTGIRFPGRANDSTSTMDAAPSTPSAPRRRGSMVSLQSVNSATGIQIPGKTDDAISARDAAPSTPSAPRRRGSMASLQSVSSATGIRFPGRVDDPISTKSAAPSIPSAPRRRGSIASIQFTGLATGSRPPENVNDDTTCEGSIERGWVHVKETGGPWTSLEKVNGKESGICRNGSRSYPVASEHAGLVSASPTPPTPHAAPSFTAREIVSIPSFNGGRERKEEEDAEGRGIKEAKQKLDDKRIRLEKEENERLRVEEEKRLDHRRQSIQERLCRLDEMDLSVSRILLLEKIHQEMWFDLLDIGFIRWNDLPWPAFVRPTCPEDLTLHRVVSYLFQVSKTMDITEEVLGDSRAQRRLQLFLGKWGRSGLRRKLEDSADKNILQGVNVVMKHLEGLLPFVNARQIDESHHRALNMITSQTFLKQVGKNLAHILKDTQDNSAYKTLLRLEGNRAQKMLNFFHALLDRSELVSLPKNDVLGALLRLAKKSELYPECLTLRDLEWDNKVEMEDSGRFGEIYRGRSRSQDICFKIIKINRRTQIEHLLKAFCKEALLWGHLSHPNVLPFYGIYHLEDTRGRICLVSPWMEHGNVTDYLKADPLTNRLLLVWDIIQGIQFLHKNKVVHGDLKGLNVLVKRNRRACLADFGLANLVDEDILHWTSVQSVGQNSGTLRWQAPELFSDELAKATAASDIYAFACVCYEIYTGHVPFHKITRDGTVMMKVLDGSRPPRPIDKTLLSDEIWEVIEMCWTQKPQHRPSAETVIRQLPLAGVVDNRPSSDAFLTPSDFRAAGPENSGIIFDPEIDTILSSILRSAQTREAEELRATEL